MTPSELREEAKANRATADSIAGIDASAAAALRAVAADKEEQAKRMELPNLTKVVKGIEPLSL